MRGLRCWVEWGIMEIGVNPKMSTKESKHADSQKVACLSCGTSRAIMMLCTGAVVR